MLIFISDPSFPFVFFFFFLLAKIRASRFHLVHHLLSLFGEKAAAVQVHPCAPAGPAPLPRALGGGGSSGGVPRRRDPSAQRLRCAPALPGPVSPWNLGVLFCFLGSVSPRASFIKVPSGKVKWQRDVGREASGITRLFELPSPPVWDRVGKGARRWVLGGRRCRAPPPDVKAGNSWHKESRLPGGAAGSWLRRQFCRRTRGGLGGVGAA